MISAQSVYMYANIEQEVYQLITSLSDWHGFERDQPSPEKSESRRKIMHNIRFHVTAIPLRSERDGRLEREQDFNCGLQMTGMDSPRLMRPYDVKTLKSVGHAAEKEKAKKDGKLGHQSE